MNTAQKILRTLVVVGVVGAAAGAGSYSAYTSQTDNTGNIVTAGTVELVDNDGAGAPLYSLLNAKPGNTQTSCIQVSYTGSLPSTVKLFTPSTIGTLGPEVTLKIESGTQATPSYPGCTNFVADAVLFDAPLSTFATNYAGGIADLPEGEPSWDNGDAVVYRVTATLSASATDALQGESTDAHTLRWEARNQ